ncbi:MAG: hypothetical protein WKG00_38820 [Polyangiaceae bacterium]
MSSPGPAPFPPFGKAAPPEPPAKPVNRGQAVHYLTLLACSVLLTIAADRAFGSGTLTRPIELRATIPRGTLAAAFQLSAEKARTSAAEVLDERALSATRWLSETTWQEKDLHDAIVPEGVAGEDDRVVERVQTKLGEVELAVALRDGHRMFFGTVPKPGRLGVAWAHIAHENGRGQEIYNNNFGNLGATSAWEGKYFIRGLRERIRRNPDVWKYLRVRFRHYDTPAEGAHAYWKVLQDHYGSALAHMDNGQAFEAAKRLSKGGYATALVEPYALGVAQLYAEFQTRIRPEMPEVER